MSDMKINRHSIFGSIGSEVGGKQKMYNLLIIGVTKNCNYVY